MHARRVISDLLIPPASFCRAPRLSVREARSDPAKSTTQNCFGSGGGGGGVRGDGNRALHEVWAATDLRDVRSVLGVAADVGSTGVKRSAHKLVEIN